MREINKVENRIKKEGGETKRKRRRGRDEGKRNMCDIKSNKDT